MFLEIIAQIKRGDVKNIPVAPDTVDKLFNQDTVNRFRGVALAVFGGIAVVMIAYAGFKYVTSQGNPQETAKAQNTILYTLIGLVVGILAVSIISFVVSRL